MFILISFHNFTGRNQDTRQCSDKSELMTEVCVGAVLKVQIHSGRFDQESDWENEPADKDSDAFGKSIHRETYKERSIGDTDSYSGGLVVELIRATIRKISLLPLFHWLKNPSSTAFVCLSVLQWTQVLISMRRRATLAWSICIERSGRPYAGAHSFKLLLTTLNLKFSHR